MRHYYKQEFKVTDAAKKICQVEGKGTVSVRTVQYWFKKFNEGDTSLEHNEIPGRPLIVDSVVILNAVETNPSTSTRRLSDKFGISQTSVIEPSMLMAR